MLRLSVALISVHDLPAAIKSRSRFSSSGVQRTVGITRSFPVRLHFRWLTIGLNVPVLAVFTVRLAKEGLPNEEPRVGLGPIAGF
jgi:hypothetical protein